MIQGRPSFQRLYGRSRYLHLKATDLEGDGKTKQERERFATAAIAFCLRYDQAFRTHFWEQVCRAPSDAKDIPLFGAENVWLEPPAWADLSIRFKDQSGQTVWIVIEVKAGAPLEDKQNPQKAEFFVPTTGYGALFSAEASEVAQTLRYIVLGASEGLAIRDGRLEKGIELQARGWTQLLTSRPKTPLVDDLVFSLGKLGIKEFSMEEAKKVKVADGLSQVGAAWQVIQAVADSMDIKNAQRQFGAYLYDGTEKFGMYIKPPAKNANPAKVYQGLLDISGNKYPVTWFGYLRDPQGAVRKSAYLYCKDAAVQDRLKQRLAGAFKQARADKDDDDHFVVVEALPELSKSNDLQWFISVFESATQSTAKPPAKTRERRR